MCLQNKLSRNALDEHLLFPVPGKLVVNMTGFHMREEELEREDVRILPIRNLDLEKS